MIAAIVTAGDQNKNSSFQVHDEPRASVSDHDLIETLLMLSAPGHRLPSCHTGPVVLSNASHYHLHHGYLGLSPYILVYGGTE